MMSQQCCSFRRRKVRVSKLLCLCQNNLCAGILLVAVCEASFGPRGRGLLILLLLLICCRWFPLTYVQFARYPVLYDSKDEYEVKLLPGQYQPSIFSPRARRQWNLYNASIRVRMDRLKPLIDQALAAYQRRRQ